MKYFIFLSCFFAHQTFSQSFTGNELKTSIKEVTVFLQGAQITRTGKSEIPQGKSILKVKSLSPHIDDKSIQVKASGNFTILSVNHKFNYLGKLQKDEKIDSLQTEMQRIDFDISSSESRLEILREKQSLLNENKDLGGENTGASLAQLKQAIEFYDKELSAIKSEELEIKLKIRELNEKKSRIEQEISDATRREDLPTSEIEIRIDSPEKTNGLFTVTFLVANAGWYPKYDVRVKSIERPLEIQYKASVYQNTGINWNNVKLRFSNGNPNQSGVAPELQTWYLNYARNTIYDRPDHAVVPNSVGNVSGTVQDENGSPLPGANVVVKGTTIGTITDPEGRYSLTLPNGATHLVVSFLGYVTKELPITSSNISAKLVPDISQLSEVVVVGYGIEGRVAGVNIRGTRSVPEEADVITTTTIENQTTVEFEVEMPYSIKSNGEQLSVDLKDLEIKAIYEYYAVPKLDKDAFLIARIANWDQYNLLEGEANLYFEEAYVGRSILDARTLTDTLNISLGRDKNIVVGRTKVDEFSKRRTIGLNKIESRGFKVIARNKKSETIKLTIFDQIPVAVVDDISVSPTELSNGTLNEKTGQVSWELNLKPQQQIELNLGYEVKYPKNEKIYLE